MSPCSGFKPRPGQKFGSRFLFHLHPLTNSAMMSTLTAHCQWDNDTARERTGHTPSHAVAKKRKSLTLHTHGCPRASLRDWSSFSSSLHLPLFYIYICANMWKRFSYFACVRCCLYPQDMIIQLEKRTRMRKIQILSHQHLIGIWRRSFACSCKTCLLKVYLP